MQHRSRPASAKPVTDASTSERMRKVRQRGTKPEVELRRLLRSEGIAYRCNTKTLPGSPDLSNRTKGWAVFVHGCFWHGHEGCSRATVPKRNRDFWVQKVEANRRRDDAKERALRQTGLSVSVVWECEIRGWAKSPTPTQLPPSLATLLRRLRDRGAAPPRERHRPRRIRDGSAGRMSE